jgi:hypothetical protein
MKSSSTTRIFTGNRTGAPGREVPKPSPQAAREIEQGRALGRDLTGGVKATNASATAGGSKLPASVQAEIASRIDPSRRGS